MAFRIREILLVSSEYDAFILSEDGMLAERLVTGYSELRLTSAPRITHVEDAKQAMATLKSRRFDMVALSVGLGDARVSDFARRVKRRYPNLPVTLLTFGEADLHHCPGGIDHSVIDQVLLWTGDAYILIAGIKLIEDSHNVAQDTQLAGVQVIIVVEDSVRRYSNFLASLYTELLEQSQSLSAEGLNELHKGMRIRARPKILLATTWEQAITWYRRYRNNLMAIITDVNFPRKGKVQPAGFDLIRRARARIPTLPILVQSAETKYEAKARKLNVRWVNKNSKRLLKSLREFLKVELGFGEFIFRELDGREVARARDVFELERMLERVPEESIAYHAGSNHFSIWLTARCMFDLAREIGPRRAEEFESPGALRDYLAAALRQARKAYQRGMITELSSSSGAIGSEFVRIGQGSLGGKGRGVAFLHSIIEDHGLAQRFEGLEIAAPHTIAIATGEFQRFMESCAPPGDLIEKGSDADITRWFLSRPLPRRLIRDLEVVFDNLRGPVAVRSSSLLEDSRFQPFAGIYATWMLANNHPDRALRFTELCDAIRAVWASTFSETARSYFLGTPQSIEEERMGIVIQEVIGQKSETVFYPHISGVGQSRNFYPVVGQDVEDGVCLMAVGLGHTVVSGERVFRFSPKHPESAHNFLSTRAFVENSQNHIRVLDMGRRVDFLAGCESNLAWIGLPTADRHGTLEALASTYCPHDDIIRDEISKPGPRVITFNNILKWRIFPLAEALAEVLDLLRRAMGGDVEIEFAVDLGDHGRHGVRGSRSPPTLHLLQVRHTASQYHGESSLDLAEIPTDRVFCRTDCALGDGAIEGIADIVFVGARDLHAKTTPEAAIEVGLANARLQEAGRNYVLVGPGRWGTSDPALGIPVRWNDISAARVIVETPFGTRRVEPSQGTHFFHNITSLGIGHLTLRGETPEQPWNQLDRDWLAAQPLVTEGRYVQHYQLDRPLSVHLQGRDGQAALLKPFDEEEQALRVSPE